MSSPYHQIALECRPLRIDNVETTGVSPPLATLRLGLAMLFMGIMLTLSVTLSLAATPVHRSAQAQIATFQAVPPTLPGAVIPRP